MSAQQKPFNPHVIATQSSRISGLKKEKKQLMRQLWKELSDVRAPWWLVERAELVCE